MSLMNLMRRVLRQSFDATTPGAQTQVESLADEVHREVEVLEPYGLAVHPPADVVEGVATFIGGESDHGIVLGWMDRTHRPTDLQPGEVCHYSSHGQTIKFDQLGQVVVSDRSGSRITLHQDGSISIEPSAGRLRVVADVQVHGGITATGDVVAGSISLQNHVHGGVRSGLSQTSTPE